MEPDEQLISAQLNSSENQVAPSHAEIALLAYTISQSQKGKHRSAEQNWLEAERIIKEKRFAALSQSEAKDLPAKSNSGKK